MAAESVVEEEETVKRVHCDFGIYASYYLHREYWWMPLNIHANLSA